MLNAEKTFETNNTSVFSHNKNRRKRKGDHYEYQCFISIILWTLRGSFQIRQKDEWLYRKYGDAGDKQSLTDRSGSQQTEPGL